MSEENKTPDIATQIATLTEQNKQIMEKMQKSESWQAGLVTAATGKDPNAVPDKNGEVFSKLVTNSADLLSEVEERAVQKALQLARQEAANRAYRDTLESKFKTDNPALAPLKDEVFSYASSLVNQGQQSGQQISAEAALKEATELYAEKQKNMFAIGGVTAGPGGNGGFNGGFGIDSGRYAGSQEDYFALTDKEFLIGPLKQHNLDRKINARRYAR